MVTLRIDDTEVKAKKGANLLWTALDNGFYIPNLCAMPEINPPITSCRLCFVEIEGINNAVTACTQTVSDGMIVYLNTDKVKRIRNTAFELLLSHHQLDCAKCAKNRKCELQNIASKLGLKLKLKRFRCLPRELPIDSSHPLIYYNPNKCVLCGKCVWVCQEKGTGTLDFAYRGINTVVSTFAGIPLAEAECNSCLACAEVCPVGSLVIKSEIPPEKEKCKTDINGPAPRPPHR